MADAHFFLGLDLGQAQEFTALAVLECPRVPPYAPAVQRRPVYTVRHLQRFALGTSYLEVADALLNVLALPDLSRSIVLVDQTAVGASVVQLLRDRLQGMAVLCPVTLAAGQQASHSDNGVLLMPRKELVGVMQVLLQTRRIQIPRTLPEAALLVQELERFKAKPALAQADALENWREGEHDDLVLAVALAAWLGEKCLPPICDPAAYRPHRLIAV